MKINFSLSKNLLFWVVLILDVAFSLILVGLPLTNVLGYEFSAINGIILSFFAGLVVINLHNKNDSSWLTFIEIVGRHYILFVLLAFIPFAISLINTILFGICPISVGAFFYFVLTIPSIVIGMALGHATKLLFKKFSYPIFTFIFLVVLLLPVVEIYLNPQVYFYTPILGYFPGNIYDEDLTINSVLITYRLLNLFYFIGIVVVLDYYAKQHRIKIVATTLFAILIAILFAVTKPSLGYASTKSSIKTELTSEVQTEHFEIIYSETLSKLQVENLVLHHEYYYQLLSSELGVALSEKITSYVFASRDQKRRLFGAGNADVAKPWTNSIFTTYDNYDRTLKHELAHVFAAEFGVTPFKVAYGINPSMIEGFAMMAEDNYDDFDIHYLAFLAFKSGFKFPLESLFSGLQFFTQTSSLSYIYSGSFIKYLKDRFGMQEIESLYGDLDFVKHTGLSLQQLQTDYYEFLNQLDFTVNKASADLYFGSKPIFKRICPRYVAVKLKEGWQNYRDGKYSTANKIFNELFKYSENYSAMVGSVNSMIKLDKADEALSLLEQELPRYENTSYYFNLSLIYGDLLVRQEKYKEAEKIYSKLLSEKPSVGYVSAAHVRIILLESSQVTISKYLDGSNFDKYEILSDIFKSNKDASFASTMLQLSDALDINYDNFMVYASSFSDDESETYSETLYNFSKLSIENMDYKRGESFANKALQNATQQCRAVYEENVDKVLWLMNNHSAILEETGFVD